MKLGIVADTHDNVGQTRKAVEAFRERGVTQVLHCGDIVAPFMLNVLRRGEFEKCHMVFGNNDGEWLYLTRLAEPVGTIVKPPYFFELEGKRIALLHEPMPMDVMESMPVDLVAFGHTHEIVIKPGRPLIVNPGECCGVLTKRSTVVVVDSETLKPELVELELK